jgi:predicted ester cyclase
MAADSLEENKELVRRLYEEGFNKGDLDAVDELVSPDVVTHNPIILDAPSGSDSIRGGIEMIRSAFPDFHVEVVELIAEGDRVASFLRMSGTNTGDYRRGGATGRSGAMRAFFIWRIEDRKLAESWGLADRFGFLQELGIVPSDDELAARMPKPEKE